MTNQTSKHRAFPWRCFKCGARDVQPTLAPSYSVQVKHDGRLHEIELNDIEIPTCQSCGERTLGGNIDDAISQALRSKLKLLSPQQIRQRLGELGLTQKEVARELGVAEATLSRWVAGNVIQSRALDRFLRVYLASPMVRKLLREKQEDADFGATSTEADDDDIALISQSQFSQVVALFGAQAVSTYASSFARQRQVFPIGQRENHR